MPEIPRCRPSLNGYRQEADAYKVLSSHGKGNPVMKAWSVIGLLFAAVLLATVPVSPQVTPRGVELSVDAAQAYTYGRARRIDRRMDRRDYRYARRAYRRGY